MLAPLAQRGPSWGRFRLLETVGGDACSRVLRVTDAETGGAYALRILRPERERPLQLDELEQLARLRHPGLPRVFSLSGSALVTTPAARSSSRGDVLAGGEVDGSAAALDAVPAGSLFVLTEWISGTRSDRLAWPAHEVAARAAALLGELADALAAIHAAGLVHGDVAPHNVIIDAAGRAVLVDLAPRCAARGTAGYVAPEAAAGAPGPRGDLYALGATMIRLVTGRALDPVAVLPAALAALPGRLADVLCRLVARDPDARPASALAVLDELGRTASGGAGARRLARSGAALGPTAWPGAGDAIDALARRLAGGAQVIAVIGVAASGARALVDAALRRQWLALPAAWPAAPLAGSLDELGAALGVHALGREISPGGWLERVARAARRASAPVVLELADDPRAGAVLRALARAGGNNPVLAIVDRDPGDASAPPRPLVARHVAPSLACEDVAALAAALLGTTPPRAWCHALHAATSGLPVLVLDLLRSIAGEPQPFAVDWTARTAAGLAELRARQLRAAPAGARRIATAIAAWGGRASIERALATLRAARAAATLADATDLERLGLAQRYGDDLTVDRATVAAAELVVGSEAMSRLSAAALACGDDTAHVADGEAARLIALAPLVERAPLDAERAALACDVAELLVAQGLAARGLELARRALTLAPARAGVIAARATLALGAHREAATYARAAMAAGADPLETAPIGARALASAGELDAAVATLAALHAAHPTEPEAAGSYALMLVGQGRHGEARAIATAAGPLIGSLAEAAGRAALGLGELAAADAALDALAAGAVDGATRARAAVLRGRLALQRGRLGLACERFRVAAHQLADLGELAGTASAELELGRVLVARGRASEALPRLASAARAFAELAAAPIAAAEALDPTGGWSGEPGAASAWGVAELARGEALLQLGQLDAARAAAEAVLVRGVRGARAAALVVAGEALQRLGAGPAALTAYREAVVLAAASGEPAVELSARLALDATGSADADDAALAALCATDDDRDRTTLARARRALVAPVPIAGQAPPGDDPTPRDANLALARACADVAVRATDTDRLERALRGHALAAQLAQRAGHPALARAEAARARVAHAALAAVTAPGFRAALDGDPELARLPGAELGPAADPPRAALHRLLAVSRRLLDATSVDQICTEVVAAAVELACAERGFVLLRTPDRALVPAAAHGVASRELDVGPGGTRSPSRALAERAADAGEPAGLDDAAACAAPAPERRSALAVPLGPRGATIGSLYVEHQRLDDAFDAATRAVLGELATLAAAALTTATREAELVHAADDADQRTAQLAAQLAARDAELVRATARADQLAAQLAERDAALARIAPPTVGDDLRLRPVLAATEHAYLTAAMTRTNGNQTVAARLLGLSRFGLQKKLRRLADRDD